MKIEREAYETATAAGMESEVPLLLIGDKGVITDVLVVPCMDSADYTMTRLKYITPMGMHRYGKVITRKTRSSAPGSTSSKRTGGGSSSTWTRTRCRSRSWRGLRVKRRISRSRCPKKQFFRYTLVIIFCYVTFFHFGRYLESIFYVLFQLPFCNIRINLNRIEIRA